MHSQSATTQTRNEPTAGERAVIFGGLALFAASFLIPVFHYRLVPVPPTRESRVVTDIKSLENALADFKANFGDYPPSRITLYANAEGWNSDRRSKAIVRRFWPFFDFNDPAYPESFFEKDETKKSLNGSECLVFFLGGVSDEKAGLIGFFKNPAKPFSPAASSRLGPFFEFDRARLTDINNNGLWEYADSFPDREKPFVYYSAYDGRGYNANDKTFGLAPYQKPDGEAWEPKSFQIISPGKDGEYGTGGVYDPKAVNKDLIEKRKAERDNITNFSSGRLAD